MFKKRLIHIKNILEQFGSYLLEEKYQENVKKQNKKYQEAFCTIFQFKIYLTRRTYLE